MLPFTIVVWPLMGFSIGLGSVARLFVPPICLFYWWFRCLLRHGFLYQVWSIMVCYEGLCRLVVLVVGVADSGGVFKC